jgi:hypothetical protein
MAATVGMSMAVETLVTGKPPGARPRETRHHRQAESRKKSFKKPGSILTEL